MRGYTKIIIIILCSTALIANAEGVTETGSYISDVSPSAAIVGTEPSSVDYAAIGNSDKAADYNQLAEDIEVMARIIEKGLEGEFPEAYKKSGIFKGIRGCQGFYLKDYGVVFITSISFPVAELKEPKAEKTPDDLWEQTKREIKGISKSGEFKVSAAHINMTEEGYSAEKVDRLKRKLLETIGDYALNIRNLKSHENIIIAVRGTPETFAIFSGWSKPEEVRVEVLKKLQRKRRQQEFEPQKKAEELQNKLESSIPIPYEINEPSEIMVKIYNVRGDDIRTIDLGLKEPGKYESIDKVARWDGKDDEGKIVPSGVYFYKVNTGENSNIGKLVVTKDISNSHPEVLITEVTPPEPFLPSVSVKSGENIGFSADKMVIQKKSGNVLPGTNSGEKDYSTYQEFMAQNWITTNSGESRNNTTLVIKVSKEDIRSYKDNRIDLDTLMKRAVITQY
jgi:hypothetical protein